MKFSDSAFLVFFSVFMFVVFLIMFGFSSYDASSSLLNIE